MRDYATGRGQPGRLPGAGARLLAPLALALSLAVPWFLAGTAARAETETCPKDGVLMQQALRIGGSGDSQPDLLVDGLCKVDRLGDYLFGTVNVVRGGRLVFVEPPAPVDLNRNRTNFWARAIVVENGGSLEAGAEGEKPYGTNGNVLNIILYGGSAAPPAACRQTNCGVPDEIWNNGAAVPRSLPGGVIDRFYAYHDMAMHGSGGGFFDSKVLALAYGGKLQLHGLKGTTLAAAADADPAATGSSWLRLGQDLKAGSSQIVLGSAVPGGWTPGSRIVVTATDYLASHSEEFTIASVSGNTITVREKAQWEHNGEVFPLAARLAKANRGFRDSNAGSPLLTSAETRAAVGLLSRSIRIVSGGDVAGQHFDWEDPAEKQAAREAYPGAPADDPKVQSATEAAAAQGKTYHFGAHAMFRQGFARLQLQGVEFRWMGQGGRIGHYPAHFHMARRMPGDTYIKDSAVNESMTRWIVIHRSQSVTLQRNVGYKSIGHGYYLEDATETDNRLYANLGVFARAAVAGRDNPRRVPGILAASSGAYYPGGTPEALQNVSDVLYPTAFWITNGWNDFVGNMAAGAGTCGACYWLLPAGPNSLEPAMSWSGYARMDQRLKGASPLKSFYRNYCSTAMHSFMAVGSPSPCRGVQDSAGGNGQFITAIANPDAASGGDLKYYPDISSLRQPTVCPAGAAGGGPDCATVRPCTSTEPDTCAVTYLDTYTSSFNWAETNLGAIWLRGSWNMIDRAFISDIQNGGVGLISGGDYSRSSAPLGYWSLLRHSVMVGESQPGVSYADAGGPKGADGRTACKFLGPACVAKDEAAAFPLSNFSTNRMINIYDGPFYEDANAFLDIRTSPCDSVETCMYYTIPGVRRVPGTGIGAQKGYLPNAPIGWKQPNGFYYPPAFYSRDLFFDNVDIRHYLTVPLFKPGTYDGDPELIRKEFVNQSSGGIFTGFTDVDRQTVLNDEDGTLTGFAQTISVNEDPYFTAPVQTPECLSNKDVLPKNACKPGANAYLPAARTSPYGHLTTAIAPMDTASANWSQECLNQFCAGVRIYRQLLTGAGNTREMGKWQGDGCGTAGKQGDAACDWPFIRMAGAALWQRSVLTADHGTYYIETTRSKGKQENPGGFNRVNVFEAGKTYNVYMLFAKPDSRQTYQVYVGEGFDIAKDLKMVQMSVDAVPFKPKSTGPIPQGWTTRLIKAPGSTAADVLEVTVDFSKLPPGIVLDPRTPPPAQTAASKWGSCQPGTFCKWKGGNCGCALDSSSPFAASSPSFLQTCEAVCKDWAVKELDCPIGGCIGFSFTLPPGFAAGDQVRRPLPTAYPSTGPWGTIAFQAASQADAGVCHYSPAETPALGSATCAPFD